MWIIQRKIINRNWEKQFLSKPKLGKLRKICPRINFKEGWSERKKMRMHGFICCYHKYKFQTLKEIFQFYFRIAQIQNIKNRGKIQYIWKINWYLSNLGSKRGKTASKRRGSKEEFFCKTTWLQVALSCWVWLLAAEEKRMGNVLQKGAAKFDWHGSRCLFRAVPLACSVVHLVELTVARKGGAAKVWIYSPLFFLPPFIALIQFQAPAQIRHDGDEAINFWVATLQQKNLQPSVDSGFAIHQFLKIKSRFETSSYILLLLFVCPWQNFVFDRIDRWVLDTFETRNNQERKMS